MLKLTNPFILSLILIAFSGLKTVEVKAETVLEEIQRTGILKVGIRNDAIPFGYRKPNGQLTGYCVDFIAALKQDISEVTNQEGLLVRIFQSTASDRFRLVEDETIHIECGPNTIRKNIGNSAVRFSEPFFVTGTQFLILESNRNRVDLDSSLQGIRIAVLRGTRTEKLVQNRYPQASIIKLQGSTGRLRGVQGVLQGRFNTFISDGILLLGQAELLDVRNTNYALIPEVPLSCDRYGMILPDDSQWKSIVNSTIYSEQGHKIWKSWFEVILSKVEKTMETCQPDSTFQFLE
ncbi:MAG: amino acid ABC transporter substrate-binding protein [Halothece sp.]